MTNPNNAVGTNGAFGGRTSVNAFNDVMGALSRGVLSGWDCVPNSGLTVSLGGNGTTRDTAIAEDNAGNKTSINNISNSPIDVTIGAAPGANSRIDAIVAYVDNPPTGNASETDNPAACGLIVVQGTTASSPVVPTDSQIRTGITTDGASGTTAYYVVIAYITMASGTTDITSNMITKGYSAKIDLAYPIGSIYKTKDTSFNPNIVWGGTWSEVTDYQLVAYMYSYESSGNMVISANKNIATLDNTATGSYTVTFSQAMADTNYIVQCSSEASGSGQEICGVFNKTTTSFGLDFSNYTGTPTNQSELNILVYGKLASPEYKIWERTA